MDSNNTLRPDAHGWPLADIIFVAIMGPVLSAAFLEWFLWLAAFLYCLVKVFLKAEHFSIRILSILIMIGFTLLRCIFLPVMIVTLPLPRQITARFPHELVSFLQWFAFYSFAGLLIIPWLFCIYQIVVSNIGRTKRIKTLLDEESAPKTVIVMPCYKEEPDVLITALDSVVDCDYPPSCLHVFLSFDGDQVDELYLSTIEKLGVPITMKEFPRSIDVEYKQARITISRFPHGGKRHCQKSTFKLIDKIYTEYLLRNDNLFILFMDSDCILDKVCIQNFMYEMELKPGSKQNMLAMTGIITSTTEKNSLITLLQDMEYVHGQLFERSVESGCGSVTCLPGALTMLRFSAFRRMAKYYFADKAEQCEDLFDYGKCHLGEDRWLTHLFMIGAKERYQIQLCTGAFCKTEAVQTYKSLLKQRRRWFLGFITNEVCMLTDWRLWKKYPLLCIVRFMNNAIRTTALLFFIMVLSVISTSNKVKNLPVGFIAVSLGLNWLLMIYFGIKLRRFKVWLYPLMFIINPFLNWTYMVYGIFTAGQRTWGGPRADAGAADEKTTPLEAIEHAQATGDDLNVVPESFKPAVEARYPGKHVGTVPVLPSEHLEGRFASAEQTSDGWYLHNPDSGLLLSSMQPRLLDRPHPGRRDTSFDSFDTSASPFNSIYMPRRVESMMGDEDRAKYFIAQQAQLRGAPTDVNTRETGYVYEMDEESELKHKSATFMDSMESGVDRAAVRGQELSYPSPRTSAQFAPSPHIRSPVFAPKLSADLPPKMELGAPQQQLLDRSDRHPSGSRGQIRHERSPLGREPLMREPSRREAGHDIEMGPMDEPAPQPQQPQPLTSHPPPIRQHEYPPLAYREPRSIMREGTLSMRSSRKTSPASSSRSGERSETESQKKAKNKLQKKRPST